MNDKIKELQNELLRLKHEKQLETVQKEPVQITKPFINKKVFFFFKSKKEKFDQPVLFLIMENNDIKIYEKVKSGQFLIKDSDGKQKMILLDNSKLLSLDYGGKKHLCWVAYENESTSYPTNIVHDSRTLYQTIEKIVSELQDLEKARFGFEQYKGIALLIGAIAIAAWFLWSNGMLDGLMGTAQAAVPAVINNTQSATILT